MENSASEQRTVSRKKVINKAGKKRIIKKNL